MHIAYQGIAGAFGEEALVAHFGESARRSGLSTFAEVFIAIDSGAADAGVLPIENSLAGSVLENYDLLLEHEVEVIGEISLAVRHFLLAAPGATLDGIKRCHSHPQALAQCAPFLTSTGIEPIAATNTAVAASEVAALTDPSVAAIASARAGQLHGLDVLASDIQTRADNTTRFLVIQRERPPQLAADKATLSFATRNEPGALLACLGILAERSLNLTKLESRPSPGALWEYTFTADIEAGPSQHLAAQAVEEVVEALRARTTMVRLHGRYPRSGR